MPDTERPDRIEFFFDPMCPYAYQSSRWIRDVRDLAGVDVRWRFFSLEEINRVEGKKHPWDRPWSYGWSQMRIGALLRRRSNDDVDRWYAGVGRAFHEDARRTHDPEVHKQVLAELGFDPDLVDQAMADPSTSDEVRSDHDFAVAAHGAFGVPTMVFPDGRAVYQQMVPAPPRQQAVELFDLLVHFNRFPQMFELRHPKTADDIGTVASTFAPYLRARDWQTIENPAP